VGVGSDGSSHIVGRRGWLTIQRHHYDGTVRIDYCLPDVALDSITFYALLQKADLMRNKILTIAIPTFNRADSLSLLLRTLARDLRDLEDQIDIIISDNASSDNTFKTIEEFQAVWPMAKVLLSSINRGPEENFCQCIDRISTKYFWILGDDDLPKLGAIEKILHLLRNESPDLVYLQSEWYENISNASQGEMAGNIVYSKMGQFQFARRVNVWFTFISGMIVNFDSYKQNVDGMNIRRFTNTSLVQLGWVLPVLANGGKFLYIKTPCVLARQGNTGGYKLFKVFGNNFPTIVFESLQSDLKIARAICRRYAITFLPDLIWGARYGRVGDFVDEDPVRALRPKFGGTLTYRLLLLPVAYWPRPLARLSLAVAHLLSRLLVITDSMQEKFHLKGC
jgi:abequosyltransferase